MLRNRNQDFAGYRHEYPPMPMQPPVYTPPRDQLDPKDERLLELSQEVGKLYGVNDLLQEDNVRLEEEVRELRADNKRLKESNRNYESQAERAEAGYKSGQQLVDEIEKALKNKKENK